jgi:gentisate 1,2-dioxygenase
MANPPDSPRRPEQVGSLPDLYDAIAPHALQALWSVSLLYPEPRTDIRPWIWKWNVVRPWLLRAGELIDTTQAERRALLYANPGMPDRYATTQTLVSACQLVLPGEVARSHRHSAAALRFIMEGEGGYTVVNGEKASMQVGDFITTPNWTWHDHGNEGSAPMFWLDGLDIPLVRSLDAVFFEPYTTRRQEVVEGVGSSTHKFGMGVAPTYLQHQSPSTPLINYRYAQVREVLGELAKSPLGDPSDDVIVEYVNPVNGGHALPTIAAYAQMVRAGFDGQPHRHTTSAVYLVVEGEGYSIINGQRFDWSKNDVIAMPMWAWHSHHNPSGSDAVLLSYTDVPVFESLGLLRQEATTVAELGWNQSLPAQESRAPARESALV